MRFFSLFTAIITFVSLIPSIHCSAQQEAKYFVEPAAVGIELACDSMSFVRAAEAAEKIRATRKLSALEFAKAAAEANSIVLDARSEDSFKALRIKGSVNLPYTWFGEETLRMIIPNRSTRVLIYCRNNLITQAPARSSPVQSVDSSQAEKPKNRFPYPKDLGFQIAPKISPAALVIPTFITLHVYGYENVWQLDPVVDPNDSPIEFESAETYVEDRDSVKAVLKRAKESQRQAISKP